MNHLTEFGPSGFNRRSMRAGGKQFPANCRSMQDMANGNREGAKRR